MRKLKPVPKAERIIKPAKLLDKAVNGVYPFAYTCAARTDIRATFERVRRERGLK